ncbi:MAG: VWA domain-containing protein [Acidobacteriia bacterium]|nr:VWA domain-containing protein [Terriglobia bacterium]
MRLLFVTLICGLLGGQQTTRPPQPPPKQPPPVPETVAPSTIGPPQANAPSTVGPPSTAAPRNPARQQPRTPEVDDPNNPTFGTTVSEVVTPALVFDRAGGYVNNIKPYEFHLYDDDKEQNIRVVETFTPISLVILIQSNADVQGLLPQVNKIGGLIGPQVIGDAGEAAVIAYDSRIRTLQDFTTDKDKISQAIKKIQPGSESNRMVDAVEAGARMLRSRPQNRRRVMLLVGETRDMGSEARVRETSRYLALSNILFFAVDMSRFVTTLTAPPKPARPDPLPPAMHPMPANVPATPTTVAQAYGINGRAEFVPLLVEIYRDAKAVFKANPVEVFTKATGGTEFGFHSQRTLEDALTGIGEQLHSQYIISYTPGAEKFGFHTIVVQVTGHPEVEKILARPGYWLGPL